MENEMITVREIARYLRISPPTAYKLVNSRFAFLTWLERNSFGGDSRV